MNKWFEIEKYCKYLCCFAPACLTKNSSTFYWSNALPRSRYLDISQQIEMSNLHIRKPLINLLVILENHIINLVTDYKQCLKGLFSNEKLNSFVEICAKYQFLKTYCVITRLTTAIINYLKNEELENVQLSLAFFATTLLPLQKLYHSRSHVPLVVSSKLNSVHYLGFTEYVNNLVFPNTVTHKEHYFDLEIPPFTLEVCDDDILNMNIISNDTHLNNLLKWSAHVSSYPVIPPDLMGNLVSTSDKRKGSLGLLDVGYDNSFYCKSLNDPIVCINCKLFNLSVGQTDDIAQRDFQKCFCVHQQDSVYRNEEDVFREEECFLDNLTMLNAQTFLHLIFLSDKDCIVKNEGCQCQEHRYLFRICIEKYYNLLSTLQIVYK